MPNPYEDYTTAGQQCSSTYEGRHITMPESYLNHPTHVGNMVAAKDPVTFGDVRDGYGVGVAFNSATTANDLVAIDTEGIWALAVLAVNDEGNSAVEVGDIIFINRTTCILSKISSDTTNVVFGYALDEVASGYSQVICVKVHWCPWYDIYRDYTGTDNEDALLIDVDDAATGTDGINRGLYVKYSNTADKTGTHEVNGIGVDMDASQNVPYEYAMSLYHSESGNPTIGVMASLSIYQDALGTGIGNAMGIDIGLGHGTNSPAGRHAFIRCRNHSAGAVPRTILLIEGTNAADYLLEFENSLSTPVTAGAVAGNQTLKLAVRLNNLAQTWYIPLYDT